MTRDFRLAGQFAMLAVLLSIVLGIAFSATLGSRLDAGTLVLVAVVGLGQLACVLLAIKHLTSGLVELARAVEDIRDRHKVR